MRAGSLNPRRFAQAALRFEVSGVGGAITGPGGAPSEPFGTSDRVIKCVICSSGGSGRWDNPSSWKCGTASGRKKFDLRANQGGPGCQGSTWAGAGLAFFLKARSIRGNITIEATTTMEASSRIRNVVTIRPLNISSGLICQKRSMGSPNGGPRLGTEP